MGIPLCNFLKSIMSRDSVATAIILKKQQLGEADELITLFSREQGKLRIVARGAKWPTSKLRHALQPLYLLQLNFTKGKAAIPKLTNSTVLKSYSSIAEKSEFTAAWFVMSELLLKVLADEQQQEQLFDRLINYFELLADKDESLLNAPTVLIKFKLELFSLLGMGLLIPSDINNNPGWHFSIDSGFNTSENSGSKVSEKVASLAVQINSNALTNLPAYQTATMELNSLLDSFISYQLERDIRSQAYANAVWYNDSR